MITIFIIILIIVAIKASVTPDKKNKQETKEIISSLPNISLQAKELSKFDEWNYSKECILDSFMYSNGAVRLKTKDGQVIFGQLSELLVRFNINKLRQIEIYIEKRGCKTLHLFEMGCFDKNEWGIINRVLSLAGTTYGTSILN